MQKEVFYNVAQQDITNGLKDFEISSSQDYFIMLEAPTNANIRVKLNSVTAHEIPIKENWQFSSKDVNKMYLSCDPIEGGIIKYGQADGNLEIKPNPTINKIDLITSVGSFEKALLTQLDNIFNPFEAFSIQTSATYNFNTIGNLISLTIDKDCKVIINFGTRLGYPDTSYGFIDILVNGAFISSASYNANSSFGNNELITTLNEGDTLLIRGMCSSPNLALYANLKKYNKKV